MNVKQKLLFGFGISTAAAGIASGFTLHAIRALRQPPMCVSRPARDIRAAKIP